MASLFDHTWAVFIKKAALQLSENTCCSLLYNLTIYDICIRWHLAFEPNTARNGSTICQSFLHWPCICIWYSTVLLMVSMHISWKLELYLLSNMLELQAWKLASIHVEPLYRLLMWHLLGIYVSSFQIIIVVILYASIAWLMDSIFFILFSELFGMYFVCVHRCI